MGYRYKNGGWSRRLYRAFIIINDKGRTIDYSSCFGLNMSFNFIDLQDKVMRLYGIKIKTEDVIERKLLANYI